MLMDLRRHHNNINPDKHCSSGGKRRFGLRAKVKHKNVNKNRALWKGGQKNSIMKRI